MSVILSRLAGRRHRGRAAGGLLAVMALLSGCAMTGPAPLDQPRRPASPTDSRSRPSPTVAAAPVPIAFPTKGSGAMDVVAGTSDVIGRSGTLLRFQVAVEKDITGLDRPAVAEFVEETFADPRGWTNGGRWRFQRVGPGQPADFTLYVVTPATRDALCAHGYDRYTNCREGNRVVVNIARWANGVPNYGASVEEYRRYAINHETGHRLGEWHELCPGKGQPAPLMQQQTLGLHGCVANAWPYLNDRRYRGVAGAYDDPVPSA
jgi:hypothetical protein